MIKKIVTGISLAVSLFSALAVASIREVPNWWQLVTPWVIVFTISLITGLVANNIEIIRRYTYPAFVCFLAWLNEHKMIHTNFAKQSNYIYHKHNRSYSKLYEITQYLYDRVMFAEV